MKSLLWSLAPKLRYLFQRTHRPCLPILVKVDDRNIVQGNHVELAMLGIQGNKAHF